VESLIGQSSEGRRVRFVVESLDLGSIGPIRLDKVWREEVSVSKLCTQRDNQVPKLTLLQLVGMLIYMMCKF
jgi:hypothetical protein